MTPRTLLAAGLHAILAAAAGPAVGGALTDGTTGPVQTLAGSFTVPQSLGTVAGGNLFHSFRDFSIGPGQTATFTTTSAALTRVISRVTGGQASNIEGTLRLLPAAGSAPDFYFINPAGITFGHGAVVNVPAAFHASTAQRLAFADGSHWDTGVPSSGLLTSAAPESFGFLPSAPAATIALNNRNLATGTVVSACVSIPTCHDMQMKNGSTTSLVAGDVVFEDTNLFTLGAGTFRVTAAGSGTVTVPINGGPPTGTPTGTLSMLRSVLAAENAPGRIEVRTGTIALGNEGEIYTLNQTGGLAGGTIDVRASAALNLAEGAEIGSASFAAGTAANVSVTAASLTIAGHDDNGATGIFSDSQGTGAGGNVTLDIAGTASLLPGGIVSASAGGAGAAGTVTVNAAKLEIDRAGKPVTLVGGRDKYSTGIFTDTRAGGRAGNVVINVGGGLSLRDGGVVSSRTSGSGRAGNVTITAQAATIDGVAGFPLFTGVTTQAETGSTGDAGSVGITVTGTLTLREAGAITSDTFAAGAAGDVTVAAGRIVADGSGTAFFTGISSEATNTSNGQTGSVAVSAGESVTLSGTAQLSVRDSALVAAPGALRPTRLSVAAPIVTLADGAAITAEATQNTDAGEIVVAAGDRLELARASITTTAVDGDGGPITASAGRIAMLVDSRITTSVTGLSGNGGDIAVRAPFLVLRTGFVQANTTAPLASGGLIDVAVDNLLPSAASLFVGGSVIRGFHPGRLGDNVIQAAAPTGVNGTITLSTPQLDLSAALSPLNTSLVALGSLLADACEATTGSSLVLMSRGGLPPSSTGLIRPEGGAAR